MASPHSSSPLSKGSKVYLLISYCHRSEKVVTLQSTADSRYASKVDLQNTLKVRDPKELGFEDVDCGKPYLSSSVILYGRSKSGTAAIYRGISGSYRLLEHGITRENVHNAFLYKGYALLLCSHKIYLVNLATKSKSVIEASHLRRSTGSMSRCLGLNAEIIKDTVYFLSENLESLNCVRLPSGALTVHSLDCTVSAACFSKKYNMMFYMIQGKNTIAAFSLGIKATIDSKQLQLVEEITILQVQAMVTEGPLIAVASHTSANAGTFRVDIFKNDLSHLNYTVIAYGENEPNPVNGILFMKCGRANSIILSQQRNHIHIVSIDSSGNLHGNSIKIQGWIHSIAKPKIDERLVVCGRDDAQSFITALKVTHPK